MWTHADHLLQVLYVHHTNVYKMRVFHALMFFFFFLFFFGVCHKVGKPDQVCRFYFVLSGGICLPKGSLCSSTIWKVLAMYTSCFNIYTQKKRRKKKLACFWVPTVVTFCVDILWYQVVFVWLHCASPDVILCGWLGSKYQLTNCVHCWDAKFFGSDSRHDALVWQVTMRFYCCS